MIWGLTFEDCAKGATQIGREGPQALLFGHERCKNRWIGTDKFVTLFAAPNVQCGLITKTYDFAKLAYIFDATTYSKTTAVGVIILSEKVQLMSNPLYEECLSHDITLALLRERNKYILFKLDIYEWPLLVYKNN